MHGGWRTRRRLQGIGPSQLRTIIKKNADSENSPMCVKIASDRPREINAGVIPALKAFTREGFSYKMTRLFTGTQPGRKGGRVVECTALERRRVQ